MDANIPTAADIRAALEPLGHAQMQELSRLSGVPFTTLWKIREGGRKVGGTGTDNPGLETVRMFMPFVAEAMRFGGQDVAQSLSKPKGEHAAAAEALPLRTQAEVDSVFHSPAVRAAVMSDKPSRGSKER